MGEGRGGVAGSGVLLSAAFMLLNRIPGQDVYVFVEGVTLCAGLGMTCTHPTLK